MKRKILFITTASHGVNHMFWESFGPLLPFLICAFDLTHTQAGQLGFVFTLFYGIMNLPTGYWSDRYGKRLFIFLFLVISSVAMLFLIFSGNFNHLIIFFCLAGFGGGFYHASGTALLANVYPQKERGKALGIHASGASIGILATYLIIGTVATSLGWEIALVILAGIGLTVAIIFWIMARNIKEENNADTVDFDNRGSEWPLFWALVQWVPLMLLFHCCILFLFKGTYIWIPMYIKETYSQSTEKAISLSIILPAIGIVSNIIMGKFSDYFGRQKSLILSFSIMAVCFFLLYLKNQIVLIPVLFVLGFFLNSVSGVIDAYTRDCLPPEVMGRVFGVIFTASICMSSLIPYLMGIISDHSSISSSMLFLSGIAMFGALAFLKRPIKFRMPQAKQSVPHQMD